MDRRKFQRHETIISASAQVEGRHADVTIRELAVTGCRIETDADLFREGDFVILALGQTGVTTSGKVVWTLGSSTGVKFEAPLHPSVVYQLGCLSAPQPSIAVGQS